MRILLLLLACLQLFHTHKPTPQPAFVTADEGDVWSECYRHFLLTRRRPRTRELYNAELSKFFSDGRKPDMYTRMDVVAFVHRPRIRGNPDTPVSPNLVNMRLTSISSFYRFAGAYTVPTADGPQILLQRPSPALGLQSGKVTPTPKGLSESEIKSFFAAIPGNGSIIAARDRSMFWSYFILALRREELLSLKWGDIEPSTFVEPGKPARKGYRYRVTRKGGQASYAEMPSSVYAEICKYLQVSGRLADMQKEDYIFIALTSSQSGPPSGQRPIDGNSVDRRLKQIAKAAGLNHVTIHTFRHSSAQARYIASNGDLLSVQSALGHSSLLQTQRYLMALQSQADPIAQQLEVKFSDLLK